MPEKYTVLIGDVSMNYVRENQRLKQESMDEILTTLTADRLLPWPAWWNKHELKKPTTTKKKLFFFLAPVEALCWRPNYRANTLYHLNFLYISSSITLLAVRISLLQFFYLGSVHWSSSLRQHPAGCPHSAVWCCGFAYIPFLFE